MTPSKKQLMELLETRFGVLPEFTAHLEPALEKLSKQEYSAAEWANVLNGLAAAYRFTWKEQGNRRSGKAFRGLMSQFVSELQKVDESLRVLGVYLDRIRDDMKITKPRPTRWLH